VGRPAIIEGRSPDLLIENKSSIGKAKGRSPETCMAGNGRSTISIFILEQVIEDLLDLSSSKNSINSISEII